MLSRDDILAALPPSEGGPNGGLESTELRRDIADELADHLGCALQRELRATDDLASARAAVVDRFGDPDQIARRLWLDAMKGTLMNQRMLIITNAVLALAAVGAVIFAIIAMRQNASANALLVEKLQALSLATAPAPSAAPQSVWAEATIPIVANAKPAEGFSVMIQGNMFNENKSEYMNLKTDAKGEVKLGPIKPGRYNLQIVGDDHVKLTKDVILYPGAQRLEPIEWLAQTPRPGRVKIAVAVPEPLPDVLSDQGYFVLFSLESALSRDGQWTGPSLQVLANPQGRMVELSEALSEEERARFFSEEGARIDPALFRDELALDATWLYTLRAAEVWRPKSAEDPALRRLWWWSRSGRPMTPPPAGWDQKLEVKVGDEVTWTFGVPVRDRAGRGGQPGVEG